MPKNPKTNRTQLTDLAVNEQELTGQEMAQVQGGTSNLNLSKSNINIAPPPGGGASVPVTGGTTTPTLAAATTVKGSKSNSDN